MGWFRRHWLALAGIVPLLPPAWKWIDHLLSIGEHIEFVSHVSELRWAAPLIAFLLDPPPQAIGPLILIGLGLIFADTMINRRRVFAPEITFDEKKPECRTDASYTSENSICFRAIITSKTPKDTAVAYFHTAKIRDMNNNYTLVDSPHSLTLSFTGGTTSPIYKATPMYLNLLYSSKNSGLTLAVPPSDQPSSITKAFLRTGFYLIEISVGSTLTGATRRAEFSVQWSGNWQETKVSLERSYVV